MYCKNCGNIVADDSSSCSSCGFNPADGSNYCPKCGHFCIPGDVECVQCKTSLVAPAKLSMRMSATQVSNMDASQPQPEAPQPSQPQPQPEVQQPAPQPQVQEQPVMPPIIDINEQSQPQQPPSQPQPQPQQQPQPQPQQPHIETKVGPKFLSADQRYCRNCGLVIPAEAQKCPFCDAASGGNYCHKCGSGTTSADTVCSVCSTPLTLRPNIGYIPSQPPASRQNVGQQNRQQYAPQQPRMPYTPQNGQYGNQNNGHYYGNGNMYGNTETHDWLVTLLLCFFLGGLGVHRFYTKNYVAGILQLISGGGCGVWYLIDLILILVDGYTDGNGNKLKRS